MTETKTPKRVTRRRRPVMPRVMSEGEFVQLGGGMVAYIKILTTAEAEKMFPAIEGLPRNASLYALHGADGIPIALTDSIQAAIGHAREDELEIASLH